MTAPTADQRTVTPADFGDPTAVDLGEFRGPGTIATPYAVALSILRQARKVFEVEAVQFSFNGTPALVRLDDDLASVHRDWNDRRTAYQRAAGITA